MKHILCPTALATSVLVTSQKGFMRDTLGENGYLVYDETI